MQDSLFDNSDSVELNLIVKLSENPAPTTSEVLFKENLLVRGEKFGQYVRNQAILTHSHLHVYDCEEAYQGSITLADARSMFSIGDAGRYEICLKRN